MVLPVETIAPDDEGLRLLRRNPYLGTYETAIVTALIASVRPRVVIEIGVNNGLTAKHLLRRIPSIETYIGVDVFPDHVPTLACQRDEIPRHNPGAEAAGDPRFFVLIRPQGSLELRLEDLECCDAVFIDGDHSAAAVAHDSRLAKDLVRPGGIIVWHDYGNTMVEVTAALERLAADEAWPIKYVAGTWLAFMRV